MKNDFIEAVTGEESEEPAFESPHAKASAPYRTLPMADRDNPYNRDIRQHKYKTDEGTFVLFRMWEECPRCFANYKEGNLTFPDDDIDYVCPHTRLNEFKELTQKFVSEGWKPTNWEKNVLKNGTVIVSLSWVIPETKEEARRAPQRL